MLQKIKKLWAKLKLEHSTPMEVAGGFAIGIFIGMSPFPPQNLLAIALAWMFRCNILAAVVGVNLHLVVFPLIPLQYVLEYKIGSTVWGLHAAHANFDPSSMEIPEPWSHWRTFKTVMKELITGWVLFGVPVSLAAFFFVLREAKLWKRLPPPEKILSEKE